MKRLLMSDKILDEANETILSSISVFDQKSLAPTLQQLFG